MAAYGSESSRWADVLHFWPGLTQSGSRGSPIRDTLYRRLQPFRYLHDCSDCFRPERLPDGIYTHWNTPPYHGAYPTRTLTMPDGVSVRRRLGSTKGVLAIIVEYKSTSPDHIVSWRILGAKSSLNGVIACRAYEKCRYCRTACSLAADNGSVGETGIRKS